MSRDEREFTEEEAAARLKLPRPTLSYYRTRGLLSPLKRGKAFVYTPDDLKRLRLILLLKNARLSLSDIAALLELPEEESRREIGRIRSERLEEIGRLRGMIAEGMAGLQKQQPGKQPEHPGLPASLFHMLRCPRCGSPVDLVDSAISGNRLKSGRLRCPADSLEYSFDRGILFQEEASYDISLTHEREPDAVIKGLNHDIVSSVLGCARMMIERNREDLRGCGSFIHFWCDIDFYLHSLFRELEAPSAHFILYPNREEAAFVMDEYPSDPGEAEAMVIIGREELPLGPSSCDAIFDVFGSYYLMNMEQEDDLLPPVLNELKEDGLFIGFGLYIAEERERYPGLTEKQKTLCTLEGYRERLKSLDLEEFRFHKGESVEDGGPWAVFRPEGSTITPFFITARKRNAQS